MSELHAELLALIQAVRTEIEAEARRPLAMLPPAYQARFEAELARRWAASLEAATHAYEPYAPDFEDVSQEAALAAARKNTP